MAGLDLSFIILSMDCESLLTYSNLLTLDNIIGLTVDPFKTIDDTLLYEDELQQM